MAVKFFSTHPKLPHHAGQGIWPLRYSSAAFLIGSIIISFILLQLDTIPLGAQLSGLAIFWVSSVPAFVYLQKLDQSPVPLLPFIGLFYSFFFAFPLFATPLSFHIGDKVVMYPFWKSALKLTPALPRSTAIV
ncbi:MAG: hypothetical protein HN884_18320, partial [Rhodospirillaceae bacterium]|nr:hypothetical protein [Rhodospirillaceae bacterium]